MKPPYMASPPFHFHCGPRHIFSLLKSTGISSSPPSVVDGVVMSFSLQGASSLLLLLRRASFQPSLRFYSLRLCAQGLSQDEQLRRPVDCL